VENLGVKGKESLEDNGWILVESYSAGFRVQISSQNREANLSHPMGEIRELLLDIRTRETIPVSSAARSCFRSLINQQPASFLKIF
jgi:hypothetical protein